MRDWWNQIRNGEALKHQQYHGMIRWCKVKQLYLIRNIDRKLETQTQTLKRRSFLSALLCCKLDYVVIYEFWVPIFTSVLFKPLFSTLYQTLKRRQYADSRARNTCTNPDWSYDEGNARWLFVVFDNRNILLYDYDSKHSLTLLFIRNVLWCVLFQSVSSIQLS